MAQPIPGMPSSAEDEALLEAAGELKPAKTLERINAKVAFIFANLSLVGTVLAGIGLFTNIGGRVRAQPDKLNILFALLFASILFALAANFPVPRASLNPSNLVDVKRYFESEIFWRSWLARIALLFFSIAVVFGFVVVRDAVDATPLSGISLQWTLAEPSTIAASVKYQEVSPGATAETFVLGIKGPKARVLFHDSSVVDSSGTLEVRATAARKTKYDSYCATSVLRNEDAVVLSRTIGLVPRSRLDTVTAAVRAALVCRGRLGVGEA